MISSSVFSQNLYNSVEKIINIDNDTIIIDTISISHTGFFIKNESDVNLDTNLYTVNFEKALLIVNEAVLGQNLKISYKTLPINFYKTYFHKDYNLLSKATINNTFFKYNQFNNNGNADNFFTSQQLNKAGSISRGVTIGNSQNAVVSSNLNLQLSGKISDNISILAAISDNNIPIQPDGSSQQIKEFDKIYISLFDENNKLTVGDFEIHKPKGYFLNVNKKLQGASFETKINLPKSNTLKSGISGAISKGKYNRMEISPIEGNLGPYRLQGAEKETYIVVLSGSEKVYINGVLLTRGQENDYIIDYNTGEISFTPKKMITKDLRIIVEFEYSDKNYVRFSIFNENQFKTKNTNWYFNIFSESDSKNQSVNQTLSENDKFVLSQVGDSLQNAVVLNVDSVAFTADEVLYKKIDTLGFSNVYIYSTNKDSAFYRLGFSYVGSGNGNYVKTTTATNGKVFKWVSPNGTSHQGDYEPVKVLISPKKIQIANLGGTINISKTLATSFELAVSKKDLNTFSNINNENNDGYAFKFGVQKINLLKDTNSRITTNIDYNFIQNNFSAYERYNSSEYDRDWNISNLKLTNEEQQAAIKIKYLKNKLGNISYNFNFMNKSSDYLGIKNQFSTNLEKKGFVLNLNASYLTSKTQADNYTFLRYYSTISKKNKYFITGFHLEQEQNIQKRDTLNYLLPSSFNYFQWEVFINNSDTTNNKFFTKYIHRDDYKPFGNSLKYTSKSEDVQAGANFFKNRSNTLKTLLNIRKLEVLDTNLIENRAENSITVRFEHNLLLFKGFVNSSLFYETGTGLEEKREFSYLKVPIGQGIYVWIDNNNNTIKELDEFVISALPNEADYIRIYTPSHSFMKVYSSNLTHTISINPKRKWFNNKGIKGFVAKFNDVMAYKIDKKNTLNNFVNNINPFYLTTDSSMVNISNSVRNTLSFNKTGNIWGADYIYNSLNNRILNVNGLDSRFLQSNGVRFRFNFFSTLTLINLLSVGEKKYNSEFFNTKNYNINYIENNAELSFQPNVKYRITGIFNYNEKENILGVEKSKTKDFGLELKFNSVEKGNVILKVNFIKIVYNQTDNAVLTYEMLQGLAVGNNGTWSLMYQQNLNSYLQLSLNYNGRISENNPIVHIGSIQLRAFF